MTNKNWLSLLEEIKDDPDVIGAWLYQYPRLPDDVKPEYERAHKEALRKRADLLAPLPKE